MMRKFLITFVFEFLLLVSAQDAVACSCGPTPNVLDSFERAKNVIVVTATGVKKAADPSHAVDGVVATTMHVDKVYKGGLKTGDVITFAQGGGADCIWTFNEKSIGDRYLFYLSEGDKNSSWIGFACGRSTGIEGAREDLLFLDKLNKVRGKTRISGTLQFDSTADAERPSAEGLTVTVRGNGRIHKLKTDKNGVYEIYGLTAGTYTISPEVPRGFKIDDFYLSYVADLIADRDDDGDVKPSSRYAVKIGHTKLHGSVDFRFEINNALRGRVFDPNGNLMKGVCVRLFPPTGVEKDFMYNADCTNEEGRFELDEVPPGNYLIVANDEDELSSSEPFHTLYYPGVFDREKATVLSIGLGEFREGLDIRVPSLAERITVQGKFVWADGKPVVDERVAFVPNGQEAGVDGKAGVSTDSAGRFSFQVLKGQKGKVSGSMWTYIGEFENCPKLEAHIKSASGGRTSIDLKSNEVPLSAEGDVSDIELLLPFPGCKKAKD